MNAVTLVRVFMEHSARRLLANRSSLLVLIFSGYVSRLALLLLSNGSNDIDFWHDHAALVLNDGLAYAYQHSPLFNHPPLMGLWSALCLRVAGASRHLFAMGIKIPGLLGEALTGTLLYRLGRRRGGDLTGLTMLAAHACSLVSILVSGFHGNTDAAVAGLALLAFYLIAEERRFFWGGAAVAAALNVKMMPLVLLPALLASAKQPKELARLALGTTLAIVPFLPLLVSSGRAMMLHILAYQPGADNWGGMALLNAAIQVSWIEPWARVIQADYALAGRWVILGGVFFCCLRARLRGPVDTYRLGAASAAVFLVFTPGFGVQYAVFPVPLLLAAAWPRGLMYGTLAGTFLLAVYLSFGSGHAPEIQSIFTGRFPPFASSLGLLAWAYLAATLRELFLAGSRSDCAA